MGEDREKIDNAVAQVLLHNAAAQLDALTARLMNDSDSPVSRADLANVLTLLRAMLEARFKVAERS